MKQLSTGTSLILLCSGIACGFSHQGLFSRATISSTCSSSKIHITKRQQLCNTRNTPSLIFSNSPSTSKDIRLAITAIRGGSSGNTSSSSTSSTNIATTSNDMGESGTNASSMFGKIINILASLWGAGGVIMILRKSIVRILPIAMEPFGSSAPFPLSTFQLGSYIAMCVWFAYVEGYKGFQLKFSPLVVSRAFTLKPMYGTPIHHILGAPFYSMGLFHATKKRKIVSWSVTLGVAVIVAAVKRLPYPWRNIIDAGVIVGLTWGSLSIAIEWVKVVLKKKKNTIDPALP